LNDCFNVVLKDKKNSIVLADFNFDNKTEYEKTVVGNGFRDVIYDFDG
jgi:hypothetical protein